VPFTSARFFALTMLALIACSLWPSRRPHVLFAASYLFYAMWNVSYLALLAATTLVAYGVGLWMDAARTETSKWWALLTGLAALLGCLAFFKYAGIFDGLLAHIALPLGISYYTFKLLSYVVDVYWGKQPAERNLVAFAVYPAFFPQILSGPIQRAGDFLQQIHRPADVDPERITDGLRLMLFGYFKVLVVAQMLGPVVNHTFAAPELYASWAVLVGCYAFVFQLYADFSGLTDIANGVALLFGIAAPPNFDMPFTAPTIPAMWRRWHITLTSWLGDYVFLPLRMALRRWGAVGLAAAITINAVAIGLWHAAAWTFLVFGLLHAVYMCVSVFTQRRRDRFFARHPALAAGRRVWAPLLTFQLWTLGQIVFRAQSLSEAGRVIRGILTLNTAGMGLPSTILAAAAAVVAMEAVHWIQARGVGMTILERLPVPARWAVYYAGLLAIMLLDHQGRTGFIYVQF
jgi:alginate O-acetyltransferase complex protein AlgI